MAKNKELRNNKIEDIVKNTMYNLNTMSDVNTIIGSPIKMNNGITVIPVSKVTMSFLTGGGEYGNVKYVKNDKEVPYAGGGGGIVSIKPTAFLVEDKDGVKMINCPSDVYERVFSSLNDFIKGLKNEENI